MIIWKFDDRKLELIGYDTNNETFALINTTYNRLHCEYIKEDNYHKLFCVSFWVGKEFIILWGNMKEVKEMAEFAIKYPLLTAFSYGGNNPLDFISDGLYGKIIKKNKRLLNFIYDNNKITDKRILEDNSYLQVNPYFIHHYEHKFKEKEDVII